MDSSGSSGQANRDHASELQRFILIFKSLKLLQASRRLSGQHDSDSSCWLFKSPLPVLFENLKPFELLMDLSRQLRAQAAQGLSSACSGCKGTLAPA